MSPDEGAPKKSQDIINTQVDLEDNFYVLTLKSVMRERGVSLDEAAKIYKSDVMKTPGFGQEHIGPIDEAVKHIRLMSQKSKKS